MVSSLESTSTTPPAQLLADVSLSSGARALVPGAKNVRQLLEQLMAAGLTTDAALALARALPKRYAIAWVCECIRADAAQHPLTPADAACLDSAEAWLVDDSDEKRRAAGARADAQRHRTPAALAAAAASWSAGSLAPPGYQVVAPAEHLSAVACYGAVVLLAALEPRQLDARLTAWINRACASFGPPARVS